MHHNYPLRVRSPEIEADYMETELEAETSSLIAPSSSPTLPEIDWGTSQPCFKDLDLGALPSDDSDMPKFSLRTFLVTVFTSEDASIKNSAAVCLRDGGAIKLMNLWYSENGLRDLNFDMNQWIMDKSGAIGAKEFRQLTDRAARGPHTDVANSLRIPKYDAVLPNVQHFFKALIGKESNSASPGTRNPDNARTLMTSIALNIRSRGTMGEWSIVRRFNTSSNPPPAGEAMPLTLAGFPTTDYPDPLTIISNFVTV
ncbi:hypothetical protein R3P38DRAFT_3212898 [Favolaschia claudopus]|uniref:Uncharacterized protein n=1 Tax=Favolaschia claudopus TaxID=2862362 RepID=A0AAW0ADB0_9AGAR